MHRMGALSHPAVADAYKAGIRGGADLTRFCPPRPDQRQAEVCFSFSFGGCYATARAAAGKPLGFVPSQATLAALVYAKEQRSGQRPASGWPGLNDVGAELQDVADVAAEWGLAPMGAPVGDSNSDTPDGPFAPNGSGTPFPEADAIEVIEAGADIVSGEYQIPVDANAPEVIAASLDANIPVWCGGLVGRDYEALGPNDVAEPTPASDPTAGGHAQFLAGYRVVPGTGEIQGLVVGSWGPRFAFNGTVWVSSAWMRSLWQAYPMVTP
jgi:hypothetical protein